MKNFDRTLKKFKEYSEEKYKATAVIAAAGQSSRMRLDGEKSKLFIEICGKTVIERTIETFENCSFIEGIIIVCRSGDIIALKNIISSRGFKKIINIVAGGVSRQESVANAISILPETTKFIAIHDGARCNISDEDIKSVIRKAYITGAAAAGWKIHDTIKKTDENNIITRTIPRENIYCVQTPQVFLLDLYKCGLAFVNKKQISVTDDCAIAEAAGFKVEISETSRENIKITAAEDLELITKLIKSREGGDFQ